MGSATLAGAAVSGEAIGTGGMVVTGSGATVAGRLVSGAGLAGDVVAGTVVAGTAVAGTAVAGTVVAGTVVAGTVVAGTVVAGTAGEVDAKGNGDNAGSSMLLSRAGRFPPAGIVSSGIAVLAGLTSKLSCPLSKLSTGGVKAKLASPLLLSSSPARFIEKLASPRASNKSGSTSWHSRERVVWSCCKHSATKLRSKPTVSRATDSQI